MMLVAICWYTTLRNWKINGLGSCVSSSFEDFALIRRYLPSYPIREARLYYGSHPSEATFLTTKMILIRWQFGPFQGNALPSVSNNHPVIKYSKH